MKGRRRLTAAMLVMVLLAVLTAGIGSAAGEGVEVSWRIGREEDGEKGRAGIFQTEEGIVIESDWLGDYAILATVPPEMEESMGTLAGAFSPETMNQTLEAAQAVWTAWEAGHPGEKQTGVFSGDAFESAQEAVTYTLSWADLCVLVRQIRLETENGMIRDLLEEAENWLASTAMSNGGSLQVRLYDGGTRFSLTMKQGADVTGTLSGSIGNDEIVLVRGWAENSRDYYHTLRIRLAGEELTWESALNADAAGIGYRSLGKDTQIYTAEGILRKGQDGLEMSAQMWPTNGIGPLWMECQIGTEGSVQIEAGLQGRENGLFALEARTAETQSEERLAGKTILTAEDAGTKEKNTLQGILSGRLIMVMYRLTQVLPEEVLRVVLP